MTKGPRHLRLWLFALAFQIINFPLFSQLIVDIQVEEEFPDHVDLHFLTYNFTGVVSMQFVLTFDPAQASFDSFMDFNLPGLDGNAVNFLPPDRLVVSWIAPNILTGQTFPGGASMMTIRFKPLAQGECSFVFDPDAPVYPEFVDFNSQELDYLLLDCAIGKGILSGKVFSDDNPDCIFSTGEPSLGRFLVRVESNGKTYYTAANPNGQYYYPIGPEDEILTLSVEPPNGLWAFCDLWDEIAVTDPSLDQTLDLPMTPVEDCRELKVDLSAPFLQRCLASFYTINYCNQGNLPVQAAEVAVEFDPFLEVQGSTIPWSAVSGNTYTFPVGDLGVGECGSFQVSVQLDCDAELGQTHCTRATILPVEYCNPAPAWSGAQLAVTGSCTGEEVQFQIQNIGIEAMGAPSGYLVIEDDMIKMSGPVPPLNPGEAVDLSLPASGSTWRVEVAQVPDFPAESDPGVSIEACDSDGGGDFSLGYVSMFPQDEGAPSISIDCQENVSAVNPNDKTAFPVGYRETHLIEADTRLEYRMRFQNTGTDTAFSVVVRDTLSALLDPATFHFQGSSHVCDAQIFDNRVLVFTFPGIMLPDSNVNEAASHGYVQFSIDQVQGNPMGAVVENRAAIFFDYHVPEVTNEVFHTIGEDFVQEGNAVVSVPFRVAELKAGPNPANEHLRIWMEGEDPFEGTLRIYDTTGRRLGDFPWHGKEIVLSEDQMPDNGLIWLVLMKEDLIWAAGKVILK